MLKTTRSQPETLPTKSTQTSTATSDKHQLSTALDTNQSNQENSSVQFLLQEYISLRQDMIWLRTETTNRFTALITLTSVIIGGIVVMIGSNAFTPFIIRTTIIVALLLISFVSFNIFSFAVSRRIGLDRILRAINRIRRYFSDQDPDIRIYLSFPIHDHPTNHVSHIPHTGMVTTMQVIIAFTLTSTIPIITEAFSVRLGWILIFSALGFATILTLLELYTQNELNRAHDRALKEQVFPRQKTSR